jgi:hypothetical protein
MKMADDGVLFDGYDIGEHLSAIVGMLNSVQEWRATRIRDIGPTADEDAMVRAVYADVAYSGAAVGAIAPLFEAVFGYEIPKLRPFYKTEHDGAAHARWKLPPNDFWNPKVQANKKGERKTRRDEDEATLENIQHGTLQLLTALGIVHRFPANFDDVTQCLFYFRNRSLHNGYEWPITERKKFKEHVEKHGWRNRFSLTTVGGQLWLAGLEDSFIFECFELLKETVKTFEDIVAEKSKIRLDSPLRSIMQSLYLRHSLKK